MPRRKIIPLNDKALTRDRLLWAAGQVLARDGFETLSDETICAEAGLERKQLYLHFRGVKGLLAAFRRRPEHWPTTQELVGDDAQALRAMPPHRLMAEFFVRFLRALRARPQTLDILAWEGRQRNEFTRVLEIGRERAALEFFELMADDPSEDVDLSVLVAIVAAAVSYLTVRSRRARFYGGVDLRSDAGWARIEAGIGAIFGRMLNRGGRN